MALLKDLYTKLDLLPEQMDYEGRITQFGDTVRMLDGQPLCVGCLIRTGAVDELVAKILGGRQTTDIAAFAADVVAPGTIAYGIRFK